MRRVARAAAAMTVVVGVLLAPVERARGELVDAEEAIVVATAADARGASPAADAADAAPHLRGSSPAEPAETVPDVSEAGDPWFPLAGAEEPPPTEDVVRSARYLVARTEFGVLSTLDAERRPFGNVVSFSDGVGSGRDLRNATGVPVFFLTTLDPTGKYLAGDPVASFTVSGKFSAADNRCGSIDAQEPTCPRLTLTGRVRRLSSPRDVARAQAALFSKHPAMRNWPASHGFHFYELRDIEDVYFLNFYGGPKRITPRAYLAAKLEG